MAYAKLQQGTDNKQLGTGGMTGGAAPGQTGGTSGAAGQPSGFTNIQDYMKANAGDTTNQNYLNTKTDEKIGEQKNILTGNIGNAPTIQQNPMPVANQPYSPSGFSLAVTHPSTPGSINSLMETNDYDKARQYGTMPTDNYNLGQGITDPTGNLNGTLSSVMDYMGGMKPISQSYTPGMATFDEMLLSGDKQFPSQFSEKAKGKYQTEVANPLKTAKDTRSNQLKTATDTTNAWRTQMANYLGSEDPTKDTAENTMWDRYRETLANQQKPMDPITTEKLIQGLQSNDPQYWQQLSDVGKAYDLFNSGNQDSPDIDRYTQILENAGLVDNNKYAVGKMSGRNLFDIYQDNRDVLKANPTIDIYNNPSKYVSLINPNASRDTALTELNSSGDFAGDYNTLSNILGGGNLAYTPTDYDRGGYNINSNLLPLLGGQGYLGNTRF